MKKLFEPAIVLMNQLKYPQKFILISLFFILPLVLVFLLLLPSLNDRIAFTQKEIYGATYLHPLRRLLEHSLQHKIIVYNYLNGDKTLEEALLNKQAQIDEDFRALEAVEQELGETLKTTGSFRALQASWQTLKNQTPGLEPLASEERYNEFITAIREAISLVGSNSNLILDPDLDSYYLMDALLLRLPEGQELLAQLSLLGEQTLKEGALTAKQQEQLIVLTGLLQANLKATKDSMGSAFRNSASQNLEPRLGHSLQEFSIITETSLWTLRRELLNPETPLSQDVQDIYSTLAGQALAISFNLWDQTTVELEGLLQARLARFNRRIYLVGIITGLSLLLASYLWTGFYLAVKRTIASLDEAAQRMAGGAMSPMVALDNKDELGQVTFAFNKIATALVKAQVELEKRVEERTAELSRVNEQLKAEIVERKQVETALRRSQQQYETLVNSIDGIVWEADAITFHFSFVSPQAERLLGYPVERWLAEPNFWADHIYPEDRAPAVDYCVAATRDRRDHRFEYRMVAADGRSLWLKDIVTVVVENDQPVKLRGLMVDVTERKQAEAALSRYAGRLEVLHEIDRAILAAHSPEEIAQKALRYLRQFVPCQRAGLGLFDFETNEIVIVAIDVEYETQLKTGIRLPLMEDEIFKELQKGGVFELSDIRSLSVGDRFFSEGLQAGISFPLIVNDLLIGMVNLWSAIPGSFSEEHKHIAREVADQLAIAIQQARLFEQVQRYAGELEQRVADRTRELSALYEITAVASEALDLPTILERSLARVLGAMRSQVGVIHLLDETEETLHLSVHQGLPPDWAARLEHLPVGVGLPGWVIKSGAPLIVPDVALDPRAFQGNQINFQAYIGVPMRARGQMVGVLSVARVREQPPFNGEETALLATIADQVGVVVESARLRQLAEQSAVMEERARLARDLHDSVTQLLYSLNLFAAVGRGAYNQGDMAQVNACLNDLEMIALQALKEMRLLVYELRPLALTQEGLAGALQRRLEMVEERANVRTQLQVDIKVDLPRAVEEALYHITQEALNNALKHAGATVVAVRIEAVEGRIELEVTDNGSGFDPHGQGGLGLVSMRERIEKLGGALAILSAPGQGTKVRASLEVQHEPAEADSRPGRR